MLVGFHRSRMISDILSQILKLNPQIYAMIIILKMPELKNKACYQVYGGSVKNDESGRKDSTQEELAKGITWGTRRVSHIGNEYLHISWRLPLFRF